MEHTGRKKNDTAKTRKRKRGKTGAKNAHMLKIKIYRDTERRGRKAVAEKYYNIAQSHSHTKMDKQKIQDDAKTTKSIRTNEHETNLDIRKKKNET